MKTAADQTIREDLEDLEHRIQRLRIEYDQYFMGGARREPTQLRGSVQKVITRYSSQPPRNTQLKFKFNSLVARFQALRTMWGRTLREIENGTYKGHRFRAELREKQALEAASSGAPLAEAGSEAPPAGVPKPRPLDKLLDAIMTARTRTGEAAGAGERERLQKMVEQQTQRLREQHPGARVKFRVVIEDNRAKLKATLG